MANIDGDQWAHDWAQALIVSAQSVEHSGTAADPEQTVRLFQDQLTARGEKLVRSIDQLSGEILEQLQEASLRDTNMYANLQQEVGLLKTAITELETNKTLSSQEARGARGRLQALAIDINRLHNAMAKKPASMPSPLLTPVTQTSSSNRSDISLPSAEDIERRLRTRTPEVLKKALSGEYDVTLKNMQLAIQRRSFFRRAFSKLAPQEEREKMVAGHLHTLLANGKDLLDNLKAVSAKKAGKETINTLLQKARELCDEGKWIAGWCDHHKRADELKQTATAVESIGEELLKTVQTVSWEGEVIERHSEAQKSIEEVPLSGIAAQVSPERTDQTISISIGDSAVDVRVPRDIWDNFGNAAWSSDGSAGLPPVLSRQLRQEDLKEGESARGEREPNKNEAKLVVQNLLEKLYTHNTGLDEGLDQNQRLHFQRLLAEAILCVANPSGSAAASTKGMAIATGLSGRSRVVQLGGHHHHFSLSPEGALRVTSFAVLEPRPIDDDVDETKLSAPLIYGSKQTTTITPSLLREGKTLDADTTLNDVISTFVSSEVELTDRYHTEEELLSQHAPWYRLATQAPQ